MNISQTQQLLSFLWSKFPNSRTLTTDDKRSTVIAYFDELWQFSLNDAIDGAREALKVQPHFVPSAPEIAHYSIKTFDPYKFLSPEYHEATKRLEEEKKQLASTSPEFESAFNERCAMMVGRCERDLNQFERIHHNELTKTINNYYDILNKVRTTERRIDRLFTEATWRASDAYDAAERSLAQNDLKQLGWAAPRFALEG